MPGGQKGVNKQILLSVYFPIFHTTFIYHAVFPHISVSLNTFMLNSNIIFNILYISHDFHNDSKQFFLFVLLFVVFCHVFLSD